MTNPFDGAEIIHQYTRAEAIADGVLIDVSAMARDAGLTFPVAVTAAVWADCVKVPRGVVGQDERGRLWDLLWMLRVAIHVAPPGKSELRYRVAVRNDNRRAKQVTLKSVCGPGDDAEPTIIVMLPDES
jgi:hypothetical protein